MGVDVKTTSVMNYSLAYLYTHNNLKQRHLIHSSLIICFQIRQIIINRFSKCSSGEAFRLEAQVSFNEIR